jgi:hypothetical protein
MPFIDIPDVRLHPRDQERINSEPLKSAFEERSELKMRTRRWIENWEEKLLKSCRSDSVLVRRLHG